MRTDIATYPEASTRPTQPAHAGIGTVDAHITPPVKEFRMIKPRWIRRVRRALLAAGATAALAAGFLSATTTASQAATQGPCDIYAAGGTPCVAAHSTTRALYGT